jgi:hypothetical protein
MAAGQDERISILKTVIEEMRRTLDWIDAAFIRTKNRTLAYIGA